MKKRRKILIIFILFCSLLFITACKENNDESTSGEETTTQLEETTTTLQVEVVKDVHNSPDPSLDTRVAADNSKDTIIIDNENREFTYNSAILKTSTDKTSYMGESFIVGANGSSFTGQWTPNILKAGYYKIYIMWPEIENEDYVSVEVTYEGGSNVDQTKIFNQAYNAGYWVFIGTYYLTTGTGNHVSIQGASGSSTVADSVMFDLSNENNEIQEEEPLRVVDDNLSSSEVRIVRNKTGAFYLTVNGEIFHGKGIADVKEFELMADAGINLARVYSTAALQDGALLDRALELGIKIVVGVWLNHESGSFNYKDNPEAVQRQYESITAEIDKYKGHPAILAWAVGNEVDKSTSPNLLQIYKAMNDIAKYIHEVDPFHPTMAVIAGANQIKMTSINRFVPHIDIMGVNVYKHIPNAHGKITHVWNGPYMIGEYAVNQPMETTDQTSWGSLIEPNDQEKINLYTERYTNYLLGNQDNNCVGSFAFKDAGAFRVSHTWYNLIVNGKKTPTYYAMKEAWTDEELDINVPIISNVSIDGNNQTDNVIVEKESKHLIHVDMENSEGENLTYQYEIRRDVGISVNSVPSPLHDIIYEDVPNKPNEKYFTSPIEPGNYRLYVYATNDRDQITTYSFPFKVEGDPFILEEQENVIIVDTENNGYSTTGNWLTSTNRPYMGTLTQYTRDTSAIAHFNPQITTPGTYRIYLYNLSESMWEWDEREIQIEIYYNNNQKETIVLNITSTPSGWYFIDEFEFAGTGVERVDILKYSDTGKVVRATAVAFLPV